MKQVLVLYAPADAARVNEGTTTRGGLGYAVSAHACNGMGAAERRRLTANIHAARCTLVLWSRAARGSVRSAANLAARHERLAFVRLDVTPAPPRLGRNAISLIRGRSQGQALRRLVENTVSSEDLLQPAVGRTSRIAAIFTAVALSFVAASAAYFVNPAWAAQVDGAKASAMAMFRSVGR
jgi:hypothetical protein